MSQSDLLILQGFQWLGFFWATGNTRVSRPAYILNVQLRRGVKYYIFDAYIYDAMEHLSYARIPEYSACMKSIRLSRK